MLVKQPHNESPECWGISIIAGSSADLHSTSEKHIKPRMFVQMKMVVLQIALHSACRLTSCSFVERLDRSWWDQIFSKYHAKRKRIRIDIKNHSDSACTEATIPTISYPWSKYRHISSALIYWIEKRFNFRVQNVFTGTPKFQTKTFTFIDAINFESSLLN